jgi:hypothetical protein
MDWDMVLSRAGLWCGIIITSMSINGELRFTGLIWGALLLVSGFDGIIKGYISAERK